MIFLLKKCIIKLGGNEMAASQPPKDKHPKSPVIKESNGLVSDKDFTIKILEFKIELEKKFNDLKADFEKRFSDFEKRFNDFKAYVENRYNELERRMDVMNIKLNLLLAGFALMISGGGYIIKLLLEIHK